MKNHSMKTSTIILCILGVILYIMEALTPKSGTFVLLNEIISVLLINIMALAIILYVKNSRYRVETHIKALKIAIIVASILVGMWQVKNLALDIVGGTQTIVLENCTVGSHNRGIGILPYYYIKGYTEDGEYYRFRISGDERNDYIGDDCVMIEYYTYTERVKDLS